MKLDWDEVETLEDALLLQAAEDWWDCRERLRLNPGSHRLRRELREIGEFLRFWGREKILNILEESR